MSWELVKDIVDLLTILGIIATFTFNIINLRKISKDNEPQLLFDLRNYNHRLLLIVKNTGKTKANDIRVKIKKIYNNGGVGLDEEFIFSVPFELSSNEQIQGIIAELGSDFVTPAFPYIDVNVSYFIATNKKRVQYDRQVFYNYQSINEFGDIVKTLNEISEKIRMIQYPVVRLANYFDSQDLSVVDEIDAKRIKYFQDDLYSALVEKKKNEISREESVENRKKKQKNEK